MHSRAPVSLNACPNTAKYSYSKVREDDSSLREACIVWEGVGKMGSNCSSSAEKEFRLSPFSRGMKYSRRRQMNLNTYQYKTPERCNI